jgi:hypothetical protein
MGVFPIFGVIVLALEFALASRASADDLDNQKKALQLIKDTAADICSTIAHDGGGSSAALSIDVKGKLGSAVGKLVDLGIDAAGKYNSTEYKNVLQEDLAATIQNNTNCRLDVFKLLQQKLVLPIGGNGSNGADKRSSFLANMNDHTPLETIKAAFGPPIRELRAHGGLALQIYDGDNYKLAVILKNNIFTGKFGIFNEADAADVYIPYLGSGKFDEHRLKSLVDYEDCNTLASDMDAHYLKFMIGPCYFGRPGGYKTYYFGYQANSMDGKCRKEPLAWRPGARLKSLGCDDAFLDSRPEFIFSTPDENDPIAARVYVAVYSWEVDTF